MIVPFELLASVTARYQSRSIKTAQVMGFEVLVDDNYLGRLTTTMLAG